MCINLTLLCRTKYIDYIAIYNSTSIQYIQRFSKLCILELMCILMDTGSWSHVYNRPLPHILSLSHNVTHIPRPSRHIWSIVSHACKSFIVFFCNYPYVRRSTGRLVGLSAAAPVRSVCLSYNVEQEGREVTHLDAPLSEQRLFLSDDWRQPKVRKHTKFQVYNWGWTNSVIKQKPR